MVWGAPKEVQLSEKVKGPVVPGRGFRKGVLFQVIMVVTGLREESDCNVEHGLGLITHGRV